MELVILFLVLSVLAIAALRWGVDSTDDLNSPEWERRRQWRGVSYTRSRRDGKAPTIATPTILMLAEVKTSERLRRAERDYRVAEALAGTPRPGQTGMEPR
jgi:hypothetical protein